MVKLLLGCTGSVASIKIPQLVTELKSVINNIEIAVIVTENAKRFFDINSLPDDVPVHTDADEWSTWRTRGDPIMHIDLGKWADVFLIAPLDANTLAKMSNGLCDNLLTCIVRAWELRKPLIFCPAMNTHMYNHPFTAKQLEILTDLGYHMIPVIEKTLMCGDKGPGAMAETSTIVSYIKQTIDNSASSQ